MLSARDSYLLQQAQQKGDNAAVDAIFERTGVRSVGADGSVSMKKVKTTPFDQASMSQADQAEADAARGEKKLTLQQHHTRGEMLSMRQFSATWQ